ncbi:glycosyltransferase family 9 protein, partial [Thermodesulfobacteriota bacterium]
IVDHYMQTLEPFGITTVYRSPEISVSIEQQAAVKRLLAEEGVPTSKPIVAIHPFSLWRYKEWSLDKVSSLILRLSDEYDLGFVICGATSEWKKAQEITDQCKGNVYNLAGKTTMESLPCLLSFATLFVGVDSVGIHIAAAVGVPTVCLYGPSSPVTWAPRGKMHRVVQKDMSCVPCEQTGCQGSMKSRCLDDLSVEEVQAVVLNRLLDLLAQE